MNRFAALIDRVAYEPSRTGKMRLLENYFRAAGDPDRGYALAAMTGALKFAHAKPALVRALIAARADPVLFEMSYDYVGDLAETVALLWEPPEGAAAPPPLLSTIVETLAKTRKADLPAQIALWLDGLDETGRWALLKLITGALRIGVSARLAKTAVAALGALPVSDVEEIWHGLAPPYAEFFAWLEGRGARPVSLDPAPFHTPMLAHAITPEDFAGLDPGDFRAEWKWDGARVQLCGGRDETGAPVRRLYSRSGEDMSAAFPDALAAFQGDAFDGAAIDGELLVARDGGGVQTFGALQQRLNRKKAPAKLMADFPAHIRAYDLPRENGADLRGLAFDERRARLEAFLARAGARRIDLSPLVAFETWEQLAAARANPGGAGAGDDAGAVEGVMIKRRDAPYLAGRPKGLWWKWKRDPIGADAVMMYAQRGHGKRSSFYSDFTFGVWRAGAQGDELVPVGKAYFGFTDAELKRLDRWVRDHTRGRFGPVREVAAGADEGLVLEVAFEGLNRSSRHKSGIAMRFPRIARIRWDKPPREADRLETLEKLLRE